MKPFPIHLWDCVSKLVRYGSSLLAHVCFCKRMSLQTVPGALLLTHPHAPCTPSPCILEAHLGRPLHQQHGRQFGSLESPHPGRQGIRDRPKSASTTPPASFLCSPVKRTQQSGQEIRKRKRWRSGVIHPASSLHSHHGMALSPDWRSQLLSSNPLYKPSSFRVLGTLPLLIPDCTLQFLYNLNTLL